MCTNRRGSIAARRVLTASAVFAFTACGGSHGKPPPPDTGTSAAACTTTAKGQLRGAAIALTSDDKTLVSVNRDVGSVTVMSIDYTSGQPALTNVAELPVGNEPWQVVIDGCNATAYVVLRQDQKVVEITGLDTAAPAVGKSVSVGSEPTGLALTPNQTSLYVSNWVDGTLTVINPATMTVTSTIDLNGTIAATGFLGTVTSRPALAHPRGVAITNNGDSSDADETVYVTEWFAVRTGPEVPGTPLTSDTNWQGLLYSIPVATGTPTTIDLPPVLDTGFDDAKGNVTGCFPNQVASVSIENEGTNAAPQYYAYVTSTCASPAGPTGVFQFGACNVTGNCASFGASSTCDLVKGVCTASCTTDAQCGVGSPAGACNLSSGECAPLAANVKTTTHPGVTIVDLSTAKGTTSALDTLFTTTADITSGTASTRMPLMPTDIDFKPGFAYVASEGADALFRLTVANGAITVVGSSASNADNGNFIDVRTAANLGIHLPIGAVTGHTEAFAFVANDGTRDVVAIDLNAQAVSASATADVAASALPTAGTAAASQLNGKRLFNTGLGRWSLNGAAWGSCGACHVDGLTDNVTWYFARGPRQTTSLDGTFNKADATDQRILNWSAINDEIADFEGNVRGISGGVGAIVAVANTPCTVADEAACSSGVCDPRALTCTPATADRINTLDQTPSQQGLQGTSAGIAATGALPTNWSDITNWIATVRSPRAPTNLVAADVAAGAALFGSGQGNCVACHSGPKWTVSKVFYTPGNVPNDAFGSTASTSLSDTSWNANLNGFPAALFPSTAANAKTFMRSGAPLTFEQLQCILRPVGTIVANGAAPKGVSPAAVNVWEVRQDMATGAQGAGGVNANDFTTGFNIPSLLGLQVGAPYFHAGNARTLEEALSSTFQGHYQSPVAQVFNPTATQVQQLVAYLLSIDGSTTPTAIPVLGAGGGDLCLYP
jgi:YVTN family beta-propeller protein